MKKLSHLPSLTPGERRGEGSEDFLISFEENGRRDQGMASCVEKLPSGSWTDGRWVVSLKPGGGDFKRFRPSMIPGLTF